MAGSASPRKPKVATPTRSAALRTLLVAWRSSASTASSRPMPLPSSLTWISVLPPFSSSTRTCRAPASSAFSTSSFTTEAGPLDHLARGDLVGDGVGQDGDAARHGENLAADRGHRRVRHPALAAARRPAPGPTRRARPTTRTALPPSTGASAGARPWGESRSVTWIERRWRAAGDTRRAGRARPDGRAPAKTSRTSHRSRARGRNDPAEPAERSSRSRPRAAAPRA